VFDKRTLTRAGDTPRHGRAFGQHECHPGAWPSIAHRGAGYSGSIARFITPLCCRWSPKSPGKVCRGDIDVRDLVRLGRGEMVGAGSSSGTGWRIRERTGRPAGRDRTPRREGAADTYWHGYRQGITPRILSAIVSYGARRSRKAGGEQSALVIE